MKKINLIIEVHQPMRLQTYRFFEIMKNHYYYDDYENEFYIKKISEQFYLPANKILLDLIQYYKSNFKISFLFSGVVLDQFELYYPEMIQSYKALADTGSVELLSGTYSNSFGPLTCEKEYSNQVKLQKARIKSVFGKSPVDFYNRDHLNYYYRFPYPGIRILSENRKFYDDHSYRISCKLQTKWLLRPEKLINFLNTAGKEGNDTVNLFLSYDIFGDSQHNRGVLEFLESFPFEVFSKSDYKFGFPSEMEENFKSGLQRENTPRITGKNLELFYESCNELQRNAFEKLYSLSEKISKVDDPVIIKDWLYLQTCDHFYFMNPSLYEESESNRSLLPYDSHYLAYINYMNILKDFSDRLGKCFGNHDKDQKGLIAKMQILRKITAIQFF